MRRRRVSSGDLIPEKGTETMAKRATARVEAQDSAIRVASQEMTQRRRLAERIREQMAMPVTDLELELWQELKGELDGARRSSGS